jgi:hypothetical protein
MKAYGGVDVRRIDPHFLDLGSSWRRVASFTPRPLYPQGKSPQYPLDRRLGGSQCRSLRRGEEKILDPIGTRTLTLGRPAFSQSLYRLRYPGSYCCLALKEGKAIPVTGPGGQQNCETLRLRHFLYNRLTDCSEVLSLKHRPSFTPRKIPGTHFC